MKRKNILIFSTNYLPNVGGAEVAIKEITDRISPEHVEFSMITPRYSIGAPRYEKIGNVVVHRVGLGAGAFDKIMSPFLGVIKGMSLRRSKRFHAYWCMMASFTSGAAYLLNLLTFWKKVPILLTLQEGDSEEHIRSRWLRMTGLAWKLALKRATSVSVISEHLAELSQKFGFGGIPLLIPNGVDLERFSNVSEEKVLHVKDKLGKKEGELFLFTSSRLVKKNAVEDVVKAMVHISQNVRFIIAGDGEERVRIEQTVHDLGLEKRVTLLGTVPNSEIPAYFHASDIFIRPSYSEGQGISFIEAMAAGLPIVTTAVGGIVDFIEHEKTGLFCEVGNPRSIAEGVTRLVNNHSLRSTLAQNAKERATQNYDWDSISNTMYEAFKKLW